MKLRVPREACIAFAVVMAVGGILTVIVVALLSALSF